MTLFDEIFGGLTPANAEARYQAFYPACTNGGLNSEMATALISKILNRLCDSYEPVLRSYALLFLNAVIDSKVVGAKSLAQIGAQLEGLLTNLTDFRVKDEYGHYVHFMSHATYLALSIHEAGGSLKWEPLIAAYLRAEEPFAWNEDIVLAEAMLIMVAPETLPKVLAKLHSAGHEGTKASNRRMLWMAMMLLNQNMQLHDEGAFEKLHDELMRVVG